MRGFLAKDINELTRNARAPAESRERHEPGEEVTPPDVGREGTRSGADAAPSEFAPASRLLPDASAIPFSIRG
jgi:hypothetical protein